MTSLIEMPELVMEKIIGFSEFRAVLTLRQVCRDFRNFIDDLNDSKLPDSKFKAITLVVRNELDSNIRLIYEDQNGSHRHSYCEENNSRSFEGKTTILKNSNIVDVAIRDLELVSKFQKSSLKWLNFHIDNSGIRNDSSVHSLPVKLTTMFGKLNRRIRTELIHIQLFHKSQIIPILQFADPETLKVINLFSSDKDREMESEEIVNTEQWKKAEKLFCDFCLMNLNVEDVCHFSITYLKTNFITTRDLDTLKKSFVNSSKFERCELELEYFNEREELSNIWGPAFVSDSSSQWYFRMKDSEEKILRIEMFYSYIRTDTETCINFDIIELRNVPNGAVIHDYTRK